MEKKETYLYVLLLPHMDKEYNLSYKVKFGYTENFDNRMKNGYSSYYGEEGYQILHVYKGDFTKEKDEYFIKQYLRKYSLYGSEWFKCCKEVLEFFNTYDTPEKLKKKILEIPIPNKKKSKKSHSVDFKLIKCVYEELFKDLDLFTRNHKRDELEDALKSYSLINQLKYIKTTYGFSDSTISKYANIFVLELADEFLKARSIKDRLKYFVSLKNKNLTSDDLQEFFRLVPSFYEEYYEFLGFDGIERLNYDKEKIIKKIKRLRILRERALKIEIYNSISTGISYHIEDIRYIIDNICERLGCREIAYSVFNDDFPRYFKIGLLKFRNGVLLVEIVRKKRISESKTPCPLYTIKEQTINLLGYLV